MSRFAVRAAVTVIASAVFAIAATAQSKRHNLNVNFDDRVASCADLRASSDGAVAQAVDRFTLAGSSLQIDGGSRGAVRVTAADRGDYAVEACRIAVADDPGAAQRLVDATSVIQSMGHIETRGPVSSDDQEQWQVYLLVQAPRNASVDVATVNGPVSVRGVDGVVKAKAVNGPVSIADCAGTVDAETTNGPISFSGNGGDVKLVAVNGPLTVKIAGDMWNGSRLEASTVNGPVHLSTPNTFRSGVRLDTNGGAPFTCRADMCRNAVQDAASERHTLQMNGAAGTIHLTSGNGPVSVTGDSAR